MAKRLSANEKEEMVEIFKEGKSIEEISKKFGCTKLTISRNLKKIIGVRKYDELINKFRRIYRGDTPSKTNSDASLIGDNERSEVENFSISPFMEIIPLEYEIEEQSQKDLSSIPISEVEFPRIVYMVVDKKIELETRHLRDYPDWQFLSKDELSRKTIEIYLDLKIAKRFCSKEQKVIKVPNPTVFKIVAPILLSRGISRIISADKLIAL